MTLGQRIQDHRTRLGLSQEGLGDKLGVSRQAVSKWEADGAVPDTDKLIALSRLFGITLNELLQVEEPVQPERPVSVLRPRRRVVLAAALAAALVLLGGVNLWLALRVGHLEQQMAALQSQAQKLAPADLVADWSFNVLDYDVDGSTVRFQVTTARYDPSQELEVFFLLTKGDEVIPLTPMEYKILALLMRSPGRIFTKIQLYEGAIGAYFEGDDNTMMVHISKLREKIEDDPKNPRCIITVRGLGYKFEK